MYICAHIPVHQMPKGTLYYKRDPKYIVVVRVCKRAKKKCHVIICDLTYLDSFSM